MNFLRNNKVHKLSTAFLLVVFVFINVVKTFHSHTFSYSDQTQNSNKNFAAIKAAFSCAICDFQIAKDSDAEVATLYISSPVKVVNGHYYYITKHLLSFSILHSVRGPPYSYC